MQYSLLLHVTQCANNAIVYVKKMDFQSVVRKLEETAFAAFHDLHLLKKSRTSDVIYMNIYSSEADNLRGFPLGMP